MADFESIGEVEASRSAWQRLDPMARRLTRRPGQKEERSAQLLTGGTPEPDPTSDFGTGVAEAVQVPSVSLRYEVAALRGDVDDLQEQVVKIRVVVEELRAAFDL